MAGVIGIPDTPIGRDSVRRSFAWALGEIKPDTKITMTLEQGPDGALTFRYYPEKKS